MRTLGIYLILVVLLFLVYCRCGMPAKHDANQWLSRHSALRCNDKEVLALLKEKLRQKEGAIYEPQSDFTVLWQRLSDDHIVCKARCRYVAAAKKPKSKNDDTTGSILQAVNEVFGLEHKPGDTVWASYDVYRTLPSEQGGEYLFVKLHTTSQAMSQ